MGMFTHQMTLYSVSGDDSETLDAVVDTNSLFAIIPRTVLEQLGVHPEEVRGHPIGHIEAQLGEYRATIICIFGSNEKPAHLGRHTLDTFLLEADFDKHELVPKTFRLVQHI